MKKVAFLELCSIHCLSQNVVTWHLPIPVCSSCFAQVSDLLLQKLSSPLSKDILSHTAATELVGIYSVFQRAFFRTLSICMLVGETSVVCSYSRFLTKLLVCFQRQVLRGVPVTEVQYKWEDVNSRFWVYGTERKVYAPDYPQQCCWGCNII